jgi:hypothetical protein
VFLTNNFILDAITIAKFYKCRWQVELFFQWIEQHLRIKAFYGTSDNAIKTQVWIVIRVYVLVAIVKKEHKLDRSMNEILQILSLNLFEKTPPFSALSGHIDTNFKEPRYNQLSLFDFQRDRRETQHEVSPSKCAMCLLSLEDFHTSPSKMASKK